MRICQIHLRPFRNFDHLDLDFGAGGVLIIGDNGRGKSNILEAISYLSLGKSIRGARDQQAIPHHGTWFDIRGMWDDGQRQHQARVFYSAEEGKRVFLDGAPLQRVSELVSQFNTVHFSPEDVALVLQFSAQRRRLLDILISQAYSSYLQNLQRYGRVLTQRNHLLRQLGQRRADSAEAGVWASQLAEPGAAIRRSRLEALVELAPTLKSSYSGFSTGREQAGIIYQDAELPATLAAIPSTDELRTTLLDQLHADPVKEQRAGYTLAGPHRDSFGFTLDGESAETYGSQGQLKSILLSWKMAESRYLQTRSGHQPVVLFDDVFSELDEMRAQQLLTLAEDFDQVILTAPRNPGAEIPAHYQRIELSN
ncbi:MAG: DNA replication and repair protein RecF [bacterium]|nr:DNA replication and repair protein RecF [bacterium]